MNQYNKKQILLQCAKLIPPYIILFLAIILVGGAFVNCGSYKDGCEEAEDNCYDLAGVPVNCEPGSSLMSIYDCECDCIIPQVCIVAQNECIAEGGTPYSCDYNEAEEKCECECD